MNTQESLTLKPFLKWAGGKRWLIAYHACLFPTHYRNYFEPFLGSGAVFFHLSPRRAYLGDTNTELIETYQAIRDDWELVWKRLNWHRRRHSKEHYYATRASRPRTPTSRAAKLIYLNRTCFNGLYRVNQEGIFNVPKGTKDSVVFSDDDFAAVSRVLRKARLASCDFENTLSKAKAGDFIYVDPPYTVKHNQNNFVKYNERFFRWDDQKRLAAALGAASKRGALVLVSNADSPDIRKLYLGKDWRLQVLVRNSLLASSSTNRKKTTELAIVNY